MDKFTKQPTIMDGWMYGLTDANYRKALLLTRMITCNVAKLLKVKKQFQVGKYFIFSLKLI